jgi:uncharacterized protein (TIGR03435 family)
MTTLNACVIAVACMAFVQGQGAPKFEVATLKHATSEGRPGDIPRNMDDNPGHFAMHNVPLRYAIEWAYDLKDYEISGPEWIKGPDERYEIVGRAAGAASESDLRKMLKALLIERLGMKVHRETRETAVYVLLPGKGPAKVKEPAPEGAHGISGAANAILFHKEPISRLTFMMSRRMDKPVLDMTGLPGIYDYTLDISGLGEFSGPKPPEGTPSIFTAIQNDLGLKLEARKHPLEILVIDAVHKVPTEN